MPGQQRHPMLTPEQMTQGQQMLNDTFGTLGTTGVDVTPQVNPAQAPQLQGMSVADMYAGIYGPATKFGPAPATGVAATGNTYPTQPQHIAATGNTIPSQPGTIAQRQPTIGELLAIRGVPGEYWPDGSRGPAPNEVQVPGVAINTGPGYSSGVNIGPQYRLLPGSSAFTDPAAQNPALEAATQVASSGYHDPFAAWKTKFASDRGSVADLYSGVTTGTPEMDASRQRVAAAAAQESANPGVLHNYGPDGRQAVPGTGTPAATPSPLASLASLFMPHPVTIGAPGGPGVQATAVGAKPGAVSISGMAPPTHDTSGNGSPFMDQTTSAIYHANRDAIGGPITQQSINNTLSGGGTLFHR